MTSTKTEIIDDLVEIGAIKFGDFTLKSGIQSPIYIDLRLIISFPSLLEKIANELNDISQSIPFDRVAGIPYTALPIATAFSLLSGKPMIYARKEVKDYGTAKRIEGVWEKGETVLIIDDLITNGESKFETFAQFEAQDLKVKNVVVLIDREQGGKERLENAGYQLFSIISIFEILDRMKETSRISGSEYENISQFIKQNR